MSYISRARKFNRCARELTRSRNESRRRKHLRPSGLRKRNGRHIIDTDGDRPVPQGVGADRGRRPGRTVGGQGITALDGPKGATAGVTALDGEGGDGKGSPRWTG